MVTKKRTRFAQMGRYTQQVATLTKKNNITLGKKFWPKVQSHIILVNRTQYGTWMNPLQMPQAPELSCTLHRNTGFHFWVQLWSQKMKNVLFWESTIWILSHEYLPRGQGVPTKQAEKKDDKYWERRRWFTNIWMDTCSFSLVMTWLANPASLTMTVMWNIFAQEKQLGCQKVARRTPGESSL